MYIYKTAYRYSNGEVEGFQSSPKFTKEEAKLSAFEDIRVKIQIIREHKEEPSFSESRICKASDLTKEELQQVKKHWKY